MQSTRLSLLVLALAAFGVPSAMAQGRGHRGHRGPPPAEAISACADQEEGTECAFDGPRGVIEGTCRQPPQAPELACVPHDHGPPPDAR